MDNVIKALRPITALARGIYPTAPTNMAIIIMSLLTLVGGTLYYSRQTLDSRESAVSQAVPLTLALFIGWVLARELDPDHDYAAFIAAPLALIAVMWWGVPNYSAYFWLILCSRVLSRTIGTPITWFDSLTILSFGGWLAWQEGWWYGAITALYFALDAYLTPPLRRQWLFAGVTLLLTAVTFVTIPRVGSTISLTTSSWVTVTIIALIFIIYIQAYDVKTAVGDLTNTLLNQHRVQAAQAAPLLFILLTLWQQQQEAIATLSLLLATIVGILIYGLTVAQFSIERR